TRWVGIRNDLRRPSTWIASGVVGPGAASRSLLLGLAVASAGMGLGQVPGAGSRTGERGGTLTGGEAVRAPCEPAVRLSPRERTPIRRRRDPELELVGAAAALPWLARRPGGRDRVDGRRHRLCRRLARVPAPGGDFAHFAAPQRRLRGSDQPRRPARRGRDD